MDDVAAAELPHRSRQTLFRAVQDLHDQAGRPSLRAISKAVRDDQDLPDTISHEVVGRLLRGQAIPKWSKMETLVRFLASRCLPARNADREALRFLALWRDAQGDANSGTTSDASAALDSVITLGDFTSRRQDLESRALGTAAEMEAVLATFTYGASIQDVLRLAASLGNETAPQDRTLLSALIRAFTRGRELDDVIQLLADPEVVGNPVARRIAFSSAASRSVDDLVALFSLLRVREMHDVAFSLIYEAAQDYDQTGTIDEAFARSGHLSETELLRAFRMPYNPHGV